MSDSKIVCSDGPEWLEDYVYRADLILTDPPHLDTFPAASHHREFVRRWIPRAIEALKPGGMLYHSCGMGSEEIAAYMGWSPDEVRVWKHEDGFHLHLIYGARAREAAPHVNQDVKPYPLWSNIIRQFSAAGQLVLDPFCGHGEIPYAANMLERKYGGCEILWEPVQYCRSLEL